MLKKIIRQYSYEDFLACDNAPKSIVVKRQNGFRDLTSNYKSTYQEEPSLPIPDLEFSDAYQVPFQFRQVAQQMPSPSFMAKNKKSSIDTFSSYGVNVFGGDIYLDCLNIAQDEYKKWPFQLGKLHPIAIEVIERLKNLSGLDRFSFHMSGTEAVLAACRMAKLATGKEHVVKFSGAYHGWTETKGMKTINSLTRLKNMRNVAGVLINPLTQLYKKGVSKSDALLFSTSTGATFNKEEYIHFLHKIRAICTRKGIPLIFDEVFLGQRLAYGGCQEFFQTKADMVIYGKSIGGGLPIGIVGGKAEYMRKFDPDYPLNLLPGKGTFSGHPLVLLTTNEYLKRLSPKDYEGLESLWDYRIRQLNLNLKPYPIMFDNLQSVMTTHYLAPSRFNWIYQYYLRNEGLHLGPYGTGRFIFEVNMSSTSWQQISQRIIQAAHKMKEDGWWWYSPRTTKTKQVLSLAKEVGLAHFKQKTYSHKPVLSPPDYLV